jgi:streptomycin 3"-adenylyltransferase
MGHGPQNGSQDTDRLLRQLLDLIDGVLSANVVGVYLHGSLAMGGFTWQASDVDFLVVVNERLDIPTKRELGEVLVRLSAQAPPKGLEMSVVTAAVINPFRYPTPHELHFSNMWLEAWRTHRIDLQTPHTDPDLAAHAMVIQQRGVTLAGAPIDQVFGDVPRAAFLASIAGDTADSVADIRDGPENGPRKVPTYAVLNFCRTLAYLDDQVVRSKAEGAGWAIDNLPPEHHGLIREALREYTDQRSMVPVNAESLRRFAEYTDSRIRIAAN